MFPTLRVEQVPVAQALLKAVGLPSGVLNVGRYLAWQPDGVWAAWDGDALAGCVSLLRFGHVGFVGCMAVDAAQQGRGLGRRLLEHAHAEGRRAGVATFLLEATASGAYLYDKLGYVDDHTTHILGRTVSVPSAPAPVHAHRAEILALDREVTASPRDTMIGALVDGFPGAVVRSSRGLAGYGLVVGERLGPVLARDPAAGRDLVAQLAGACTVSTVPVPNDAALTALLDAGFTITRTLRRMRLGAAVPARVSEIWALASAGAG